MKRCTKKYKVDDGYSQYWFNKLYNYVMSLFAGKPCFNCGKVTPYNCGHHVLLQCTYHAFRCDPKHIVPCCPTCHAKYAKKYPSAHSGNPIMLYLFMELIRQKCPAEFAYAMEHAYDFESPRINYKECYDKLTKEVSNEQV